MLQKDNKKFYINDHDWYWTPSEWNVEWRLKMRKLGINNVHFAQELSRFYYHKMIQEKEYVDPYFADETKLNAFELEQANQSKEFYAKMWEKYVPGMSPLDKALNLLALLKKQHDASGGVGGQRGRNELMDVDIEKALEHVPEKEIFESSTLNEIFDRKEGLDDFDKKINLMNKIAMVEKFGKTFDVKKIISEKRVTNSRIHKQKRMVEYEELINSPLYQKILPNYQAKLISKDLVINTPVVYEESKQKIIILVDYSGSMSMIQKQDWVLSILADRLRYCVKEECEIFFSFFLTARDVKNKNFKFTHIYNRETALKFFKELSTAPSGGDTEVGHVIELIREEIMDNKRLFNLDVDLSFEKPEILVINDGQDSVKTDKLTWKTNAITLYGNNPELEALCKKTGGKFISIDGKQDHY